ncbi:MAG: MFS transporter [Chloroflexota bacterium]
MSRGLLTKVTLLAASTLTVMAAATIAPSLPAMQVIFEGLPNAPFLVRLVLTLPALFIAIGSPFAGAIIDRFGRKWLLVGAMLLYGLAGGSAIIAPTLSLILVGRAILGATVAGIRTATTTLIADYYDGAERAQMMGFQAAAAGFGGSIFLTIGGFLADISWRGPFYLYLISFLILPMAMLYIRRQPETRHRGRITESGEVEQLPIGLMVFIYLIVMLTQIVFYLVPVQLPFHLKTILGATATQTGMGIATTALFYALASLTFGWLSQRMGRVLLMITGFAVTGLGYLLIGTSAMWLPIILGLMMGGFGLGMVIPNLNLWLANDVPLAVRGRALGGFTTFIFVGQFISPFISQPLATMVGIGGTYVVIGFALLVLVVALFLMRHRIDALGNTHSQ